MKENNIPTGHFKLEESNSIIKNWNELSDRFGLDEKEKTECIEGFDIIHPRSNNRYKKHILGIYLGKDIDRHGLASYEIWRRICFKRRMSRFSKEEEELILKRVEELGKSSQAFQVISKELGRFYSVSVKNRYKQLTQKSPMYRRGPFTQEEDDFILAEIDKLGENAKAFNEVALKIGRRHSRNIKFRYYKLKYSTVAEPKKDFTPAEQEELIKLILNEYPNTELKYIKPTDAFFTDLYKKFKRDSSILEKHWLKVILPALLSHELGLSNQNWQIPLIQILLTWTKESKIRMARDLDYMELLELFPGQTKQSIQYFLTIMSRNIIKKVGRKDLSFQEILENAVRLNYSARSPLISTVIRNDILVDIYENIKKSKQIKKC
uniref:Uncharacterized protein n=1 Tax=Lepeophtheirus salmonis TaxID=72036 RepID=A0A0K2TUL6_LEPSM